MWVSPNWSVRVKSGAGISGISPLSSCAPPEGASCSAAGSSWTAVVPEAAARSAALSHAGVSESSASRIEIELDRDDGRTLYEVEFHVGRTEYSYEIDAYSGAVLKAEQEIDD